MPCRMADVCESDLVLTFEKKTSLAKVTHFNNVAAQVHPKAWMGTELTVDQIGSLRRKRPGASLGVRFVPALDLFRCRINRRVKEEFVACHADLAIVLGGMTSRLWPLNVSFNDPTKHHVCTVYNERLVDGEHAPQLWHSV